MRIRDVDTRIVGRAEAVAQDQADFLRGLVSMRKRRGLSQGQLAERMGITQAAVVELERYDANPTLSTVLRYAVAVEVKTKTQIIDDSSHE